ncbi:EmrB/QacA subfamily drug resistance transporter [Kribbella sp. VKM Ac-2527]|uniref:EmrB/QacA subfamily drug resistance transporter n=1 Tax=Kribbella caucasensis TaxID=2512215 RepID=A0A4R6J5M5_9ACTN|nr:MFS transporter [Kribbella sp. VKM Ac-2527]TDO30724.1 EmrB/QacA subfamily drug resistance transporter [Kribbella sp. VKM Ac-2527]
MSNAPDPKRWLALALLCLAAFMIILDASIVLVAVPSIERDLTFSAGGVQWVPSGYALMFGGLLLLGGRVSDLLGRRRVFVSGLVLFGASSLLCGFAWSGDTLVLARGLQGIAAAVLAPSALSIVMTTFPDGAERNKALGIWGAVSGVGGTAGSLIGGPVTDGLGWQWIFFINIPVCVLVIALAPVLLQDSRGPGSRGFDIAGAVTVTAALIVLVYAVIEAPGSSAGRTVFLGLVSAALFALFVRIEQKSSAPLVPLRLFRSRAVVGGNLITIAFGFGAFGLNFIYTQYAQLALGYSAVEYGLMSSVLAATAVVGSIAGQNLVTRIGVQRVATVSLLLTGIGATVMSRSTAQSGYFELAFWGLAIFGAGLGAGCVAGAIAALGEVSGDDAGVASGLQNACFQIGGAVGIAALSAVAVANTRGTTPTALTAGYRVAYAACWAFVAVGLVGTGLLVNHKRTRELAAAAERVA